MNRLSINRSPVSPGVQNFADDVRAGLDAEPKRLSPKYFYDALGSQLFEAICLLPEYYLTAAETEIFLSHASDIVASLPGPLKLIELGSGSSLKTRLLIEAILKRQPELHYQPIDISESILEQSSSKLLGDYADLRITAQVSDYTRGLGSTFRSGKEKALALFLGSNIGNYAPDESRSLLRQLHDSLRKGDGLLLGADLKKSREELEQAYDDGLGVTAAFNLNLLLRINRELGADFDLKNFRHLALYNADESRIEMHLVSNRRHTVRFSNPEFKVGFEQGESIHTESSYKYDMTQLAALAAETGFRPVQTWMDEKGRFSCNFWLVL